MKELKKIMFIASFPPDKGGGGGVILRSLYANYPSDKIVWVNLAYSRFSELKQKSRFNVYSFPYWFRGVCTRKMFHWIWSMGFCYIEAFIFFLWCLRFIIKEKPDCIQAIVDQRVIFAQLILFNLIKIPFHVTIHDDPVLAFKLNSWMLPKGVETSLSWLYKNAITRDCISNRMINLYKKKYLKDAFVLHRAIDPILLREKKLSLKNKSIINVCMGGSAHCPPPFPDDILKSLELLEGQTKLDIRFHAFDSSLKTYRNVIVPPILNDHDFNDYLKSMDIGFSVDPLTSVGQAFAASSLPTKIVTYMSHSLPFVYQGSKDSTVGDIVKEYRCGIIVESHLPEDICNGFLNVLHNYDAMSLSAVEASKKLFNKDFFQELVYKRYQ